MTHLLSQLDLSRCPYCNVDTPSINQLWAFTSTNFNGTITRYWKVYICSRCGGLITASSLNESGPMFEMYPAPTQVADDIPGPSKTYLQQALNSRHSPAGAVMLTASSIDAMLKNKSYKEGSLKSRIDKAAADHLITPEMALWAHNVRLDANEQRHADESDELPTEPDAQRSIDFAMALGEFLFVLPNKVKKGITESGGQQAEEPSKES